MRLRILYRAPLQCAPRPPPRVASPCRSKHGITERGQQGRAERRPHCFYKRLGCCPTLYSDERGSGSKRVTKQPSTPRPQYVAAFRANCASQSIQSQAQQPYKCRPTASRDTFLESDNQVQNFESMRVPEPTSVGTKRQQSSKVPTSALRHRHQL